MAKKKAAEEEGGKPKKDKKKLIAIVVVLAGAWKFGFLPVGGSKAAEGATTTTQMLPGDAVAVGDPIVVNLSDTETDRYARVGIAIVLPGHGEVHEAEEVEEETTTRRTRATTAESESETETGSETSTTAGHADETAETEAPATEAPATEAATTDGGHSLGALGAPGRPAMAAVPRSGGAADPAAALEPKFPRLRSAAINIIRTYSAAELLAADGPANLEADITDAAFEIYGDEDIYGVIITELIVQ